MALRSASFVIKVDDSSAERLGRRVKLGQRAPIPRPRTVSIVIHDALRDEILAMRRKPGEPLSEKDIAAQFGVSRTPVREAVLKLVEERLIEIFPQSGTFVARIPIEELGEAMLVRAALEKTTVALAAHHHREADLATLSDILDRQEMAAKAQDRDAFHDGDEAFHQAIALAAGYPNIWRLVTSVKYQVDRYRRLTLPAPGRMVKVIAEHRAIYDAIAARNATGATEAMENHLAALMGRTEVDYINPDYLVRTAPQDKVS
jgi:DNA-binding GntR family transcriptional regulator